MYCEDEDDEEEEEEEAYFTNLDVEEYNIVRINRLL